MIQRTCCRIVLIIAGLAMMTRPALSQDVVVEHHTQQVVRTAFHAKPFPQLVSLDGGAVPPPASFRDCDPGELAMVRAAGDLVAKLVQEEGGGRKWSAASTTAPLSESQYGFDASVLPSPNGSYVIRVGLSGSQPDVFMKGLAAFGDCLTVSFGSEERATQLGLLPLPRTGLTIAQYAPTVGFYIIRIPFRR
ncbi:MAG TPA: hypothetical protein VFO29_02925 [Candidatus Rubrimentiphilum sp.]|nr:hypothetical protein [Candidatus Rubrimentiphilum sp.]